MDLELTKGVVLSEVIEYRHLFPEEKSLDIKNILKKYDRTFLIKLSSLLNFYYNGLRFPYTDGKRHFFSNPQSKYVKEVQKRWYNYCSKRNLPINHSMPFILHRTGLEFLKILMSIEPNAFKDENVNRDKAEYDFFKVILIINQNILSCNLETIHQSDYETMIYLNQYATNSLNDFKYRSIILRQIAYSQKIFETISTNHNYQKLYNAFLNKWHVHDWREYTNTILCFFMILKKNNIEESPTTIGIPSSSLPQNLINIDILDTLSISYDEVCSENTDYKCFRERPIIKFKDFYMPINLQLLSECIYNGIYFTFKNICDNILCIKQFDKIYKQDIFEHFVFQQTMWDCIKKFNVAYPQKEIVLSNENLNETPNQPDFYLRKGNKAALFECKAIKLNAILREQADTKELTATLRKKLYNKNESNGKPKWVGVPQLLNNIEKAIKHEITWDKPEQSVSFYPILVLEDSNIIKASFNALMYRWQKEFLGNDNRHRIKPIIVMSADTLILYSKSFSEKGFFHYFDKYLSSNFRTMPNGKKDFKIQSNFNEFMDWECKHTLDLKSFIKKDNNFTS